MLSVPDTVPALRKAGASYSCARRFASEMPFESLLILSLALLVQAPARARILLDSCPEADTTGEARGRRPLPAPRFTKPCAMPELDVSKQLRQGSGGSALLQVTHGAAATEDGGGCDGGRRRKFPPPGVRKLSRMMRSIVAPLAAERPHAVASQC